MVVGGCVCAEAAPTVSATASRGKSNAFAINLADKRWQTFFEVIGAVFILEHSGQPAEPSGKARVVP